MRVLWCLLSAVLLIAGWGSASKGDDVVKIGIDQNDVAKAAKLGLTEPGRLNAFGCVDDHSEDDTEYCTITDIDGVPATPREEYRTWYGVLPGEHHIKVRSNRGVQKEVFEMSFVAQSGHWYEVIEQSARFPQGRFVVYDSTGDAVVAHVGGAQ
jgi:hypothetical protein